jgi:flagellar biogenesis protein FliO
MGWADDEGPGDNPSPSALASCMVWSIIVIGFVLFLVWLIVGLVRDLT